MKKNHFSSEFMSYRDNIFFRIHSFELEISQNERVDYPEVHAHHYDEIHYIFSGTTTLMLEGNKPDVVLSEGDFCLVPAGVYHCRLSNEVSHVIFAVEIESGKSQKKGDSEAYHKLRAILDAKGVPFVFNDPNITDAMLQYQKLRYKDSLLKETQLATVLMNAILYALNLLRESDIPVDADTLPKPTSELTDKRRIIIENHIDDFFNSNDGLKTLAAKLYLSERRTSEIVREIMGESFKDLVIKERMTVASILIKCKKYSLEKIADMVGYHSYSGFYTAYRSFFGHPPTDDVV
ncbi:MAG: helix-turn-helix domain-containing protein [Clostridia bacterium]|nr:helix-turn-helix domain-containing protein [Clostridia bacterium]